MHSSQEVRWSRDEAKETNRIKNKLLCASLHLLGVDGRRCRLSGHEGGQERDGQRLGHRRVVGKIGGSVVKLKG